MVKERFLRPCVRPERMVPMKFGSDFFKIFNFAVLLIRLFFRVFGDDEDKKQVAESEARSFNSEEDAC